MSPMRFLLLALALSASAAAQAPADGPPEGVPIASPLPDSLRPALAPPPRSAPPSGPSAPSSSAEAGSAEARPDEARFDAARLDEPHAAPPAGPTARHVLAVGAREALEVEVVNGSAAVPLVAEVVVAEAPAWLTVEAVRSRVEAAPGAAGVAAFTLAVGDGAAAATGDLVLRVVGAGGALGEHRVALAVAPPLSFRLHPPRPNPAAGSVTVAFDLPEGGPVLVDLVDALGRRVAVVADGERGAGTHTVAVGMSRLAPGVYTVRLRSGAGHSARRLTVLR